MGYCVVSIVTVANPVITSLIKVNLIISIQMFNIFKEQFCLQTSQTILFIVLVVSSSYFHFIWLWFNI